VEHLAGETAVNLRPAQFNEFGLDSFFFKLLQNVAQQDGRISTFAGAAVQSNNFCMSSVHRQLSPHPASAQVAG